MKKQGQIDQPDPKVVKRSRRAQLQALLFTGAALGTTLVTLLCDDGKWPRVTGE